MLRMDDMFFSGDGGSDQFVISDDDVVDVFVGRKNQQMDNNSPGSGISQELRGEIVSLLLQSDDQTASTRSDMFFAAAEMAAGMFSRVLDPPSLGSTSAPITAVPVVNLVRKVYAPVAELYQSKDHGDCRTGHQVKSDDMNLLLGELSKHNGQGARSASDTAVRSRRWELMRRYEVPPSSRSIVRVVGTHANVLLRCGPSILRAVRLLGPASGYTPAEGRTIFSGEEVASDRTTEIALIGRNAALAISRKGCVRIRGSSSGSSSSGPINPDLLMSGEVAALFSTPEAAAAALPRADVLLAKAQVLSLRDAAMALGVRFIRLYDEAGLIKLVNTNIGVYEASQSAKGLTFVQATRHHRKAEVVHVTEEVAKLLGRERVRGRETEQRVARIRKELLDAKKKAQPDCTLAPLGDKALGLRGWMRRSGQTLDGDSGTEVSSLQGHLRTSDVVLVSRASGYVFDHLRTVDSSELCFSAMRTMHLETELELLDRTVPDAREGPDASAIQRACAAWLQQPPRHPHVMVTADGPSKHDFDDDDGMVLAISDNVSYRGMDVDNLREANLHRSNRSSMLNELEGLLGVSPPLSLAESALLLDMTTVLVPPGNSRADVELRRKIEDVGRRRAELIASYRHRKQPFREIEAELVRNLRIRSAPLILLEEIAALSALLSAHLSSAGESARVALSPSSALASVCSRGSRGSRGKPIPLDRLVVCAASSVLSGRVVPDLMPAEGDVEIAIRSASREVQSLQMHPGRVNAVAASRRSGAFLEHFLPAPGVKRADPVLYDSEKLLQESYVTIRMPDGRTTQPVRSCCPSNVAQSRWDIGSRNYYQPYPPGAPSDVAARHVGTFAGPAVASLIDNQVPVSHADPQILLAKDPSELKTTMESKRGLDGTLSMLDNGTRTALMGVSKSTEPDGTLRIVTMSRLSAVMPPHVSSDNAAIADYASKVWDGDAKVFGIAMAFVRNSLYPALGRAVKALSEIETTSNADDIVSPVIGAIRGRSASLDDAKTRFGQALKVCRAAASKGDDGTCLAAAIFTVSVIRGNQKSPEMMRASAAVLAMMIEHTKFNRRDMYDSELLELQAKREQLRRKAAAMAENMTEEQKQFARELNRLGLLPGSVMEHRDDLTPEDSDKLAVEPGLPPRSVDASDVFEF